MENFEFEKQTDARERGDRFFVELLGLFGATNAVVTPESSRIDAIGFNRTDGTLYIVFKPQERKTCRFTGGEAGVYRYPNTSEEFFASFAAASSKGAFFSREIRTPEMPYEKIGEIRFVYKNEYVEKRRFVPTARARSGI